METITITVTQEDIDKGCRLNPCGCPIALAVKRLNKWEMVSVGNGINVWKDNNQSHYHADLPFSARHFMQLFDLGHKIPPFTFTATFSP